MSFIVTISDWKTFLRMYSDWQNLFYQETESAFQLYTFKYGVAHHFCAMKNKIKKIHSQGLDDMDAVDWFRLNILEGQNAIKIMSLSTKIPGVIDMPMEEPDMNDSSVRSIDNLQI